MASPSLEVNKQMIILSVLKHFGKPLGLVLSTYTFVFFGESILLFFNASLDLIELAEPMIALISSFLALISAIFALKFGYSKYRQTKYDKRIEHIEWLIKMEIISKDATIDEIETALNEYVYKKS